MPRVFNRKYGNGNLRSEHDLSMRWQSVKAVFEHMIIYSQQIAAIVFPFRSDLVMSGGDNQSRLLCIVPCHLNMGSTECGTRD
jgi:hypothetical protein